MCTEWAALTWACVDVRVSGAWQARSWAGERRNNDIIISLDLCGPQRQKHCNLPALRFITGEGGGNNSRVCAECPSPPELEGDFAEPFVSVGEISSQSVTEINLPRMLEWKSAMSSSRLWDSCVWWKVMSVKSDWCICTTYAVHSFIVKNYNIIAWVMSFCRKKNIFLFR